MDQRSIALYQAMKGLSAVDIHRDLTETLDINAVSYSTVTRYIRMTSCTDLTDVDEIHSGPKSINETDEAILKALADEPFSSVRELARHTCMSKITIQEREKHMIQSPKLMITVARNTSGFHVIEALPKCTNFNASYYTTQILERINEWRNTAGTSTTRKLIVHADNAKPHTAKSTIEYLEANAMKKAQHPSTHQT
jgi:hypothetical protein